MSVEKETFDYTARQVVLSSPKPFKAVAAALNYELNADKAGTAVLQVMANSKTREDLENGIYAITEGKRDFMFFGLRSHSHWMRAYYKGEEFKETIVYTIGNPLIAQGFLKHDMSAGLYVPPRILVREMTTGGTSIQYDLPSSIIVRGTATGEFKAALEDLDSKLERMVRRVLAADTKL